MADVQTDTTTKVQTMIEKSIAENKAQALEGSKGLETPEEIATHILGTTLTACKGYVDLGILDPEVAKSFLSSSVSVIRDIAAKKSGVDSLPQYNEVMNRYWNERAGETFGKWTPLEEKVAIKTGDVTSQ